MRGPSCFVRQFADGANKRPGGNNRSPSVSLKQELLELILGDMPLFRFVVRMRRYKETSRHQGPMRGDFMPGPPLSVLARDRALIHTRMRLCRARFPFNFAAIAYLQLLLFLHCGRAAPFSVPHLRTTTCFTYLRMRSKDKLFVYKLCSYFVLLALFFVFVLFLRIALCF